MAIVRTGCLSAAAVAAAVPDVMAVAAAPVVVPSKQTFVNRA